jgi:hypothetical protein
LHKVYSLVEEAEVAAEGEYVLCLGYACLAIKEIFENLSFPPLPIGVGFDSGDVILVRAPEQNAAEAHEGQLRLWED